MTDEFSCPRCEQCEHLFSVKKLLKPARLVDDPRVRRRYVVERSFRLLLAENRASNESPTTMFSVTALTTNPVKDAWRAIRNSGDFSGF